MTYAVSSYHMHHLLKVWDDAFDVTFQATPVCKAQTGEAWPVTPILCMEGDCKQGIQP